MTLRIGLVSTLATPVRRDGSGSIEALVWLLAREFTALGHKVTVFGAGGSVVDGTLIARVPGTYGAHGAPDDWQVCEWMNLCEAVAQSGGLDVLHSHSYLYALPLARLSRAPVVSTMHMFGDDGFACIWRSFPAAC